MRLLLLHGLGATGEVWNGLRDHVRDHLDGRWPGGVLAPDLPGHGAAPPLGRYSFGAMAAAVAGSVGGAVGRDEPVAVLGHSLGGVLALALASGWFGLRVTAAAGLGIKVSWSEADVARAAATAARPAASYPSREEAAARFLRVAGLDGLVAAGDPMVDSGLVRRDGAYRLALDSAAFAVGVPDMAGLLAAARCPVVLAAGEHDPLSPAADLRALDPDATVLPGLGHNAHVEDPPALVPLLDRLDELSQPSQPG